MHNGLKNISLAIRYSWRYLRYRLKARNAFHLHSPFLYSFYTTVIQNKQDHDAYAVVSRQRKAWLDSEESISVLDLGAGNRSGVRKVRQIARNASKSPKYSKLLYRMVCHFQPKNILELGTSLGLSTTAMALAKPDAKTITLEGCPQTAAIAAEALVRNGLGQVTVQVGDFIDTLPMVLCQYPKLDFVFIDGNHQRNPTLQYFHQLLPHLHSHSCVVLDDIHWSNEMEQAWHIIAQNPAVVLSIDLFQMGILLFDPRYLKQDYILKF